MFNGSVDEMFMFFSWSRIATSFIEFYRFLIRIDCHSLIQVIQRWRIQTSCSVIAQHIKRRVWWSCRDREWPGTQPTVIVMRNTAFVKVSSQILSSIYRFCNSSELNGTTWLVEREMKQNVMQPTTTPENVDLDRLASGLCLYRAVQWHYIEKF